VCQGWKGKSSKIPGIKSISKRNKTKWESVVRKIHQWMYSWMRPGYVEDEEEYIISKFLLLKFISSSSVLEACDGNIYTPIAILRFVHGYVFVHEKLYLHYLRKKIRHFNTSHASAHEVRICVLLLIHVA